MKNITKNEMKALLVLLKDINADYNANNLSKKIGLTPMGTLKIVKKLEKQNILKSKQLGKAVFYNINLNDYTKIYLKFLLQKEAEECSPKVKRWVKELKPLQKTAEAGILFGSVLTKENYNDVDLLLILKQSQNKEANMLIGDIKKINIKKLHAVKQTIQDLKSNLKKKDKVILSIIKNGIVLFGYEKIIEVIEHAR